LREEVVDFVAHYAALTGLAVSCLLGWIGLGRERLRQWRGRYGQANRHNAGVARDFWIEPWERAAILEFWREHQEEGYRRLAYMMLDRNVVALSPSSVYRVLKGAGVLVARWRPASRKGRGFEQPLAPHEHWHVDVSYLNICATFYYFCGLLDGFSRYVAHWEIRESMKEKDVEIIIQRGREKWPEARPRIISDNGPQFIARDLKELIRRAGMTHVQTSRSYPQSNGKIERFHQSLKAECLRRRTPVSLEDARRVVAAFIDYYNNERLHSAIGYVAPRDKLQGSAPAIFAERRRKLHQARERRKARFENCATLGVSVRTL
jgi:transposase InsO family protein